MLASFIQAEASAITKHWSDFGGNLQTWDQDREIYRQQLREMLSLDPMPEKTELKATITGTLSHPDFVVENLHFQSRPGLYCTANVYVPKDISAPVPAILYVCGHGQVKENGVSLGNKVHYQHHGAWFARNGYICMVLDSVQLGEIEGIHHGTHRYDMWWWNSRGYTSAGAEAWNCIRALDYLQSRADVDSERLGVTGRSGGGAYSWWIAALDQRIKVACPVAGITDLRNHAIDGCVEGHCDCMYMVNTYRWDYCMVAALLAPRPLLICNTDKDNIFPLDGVIRLHSQVRNFYDYYDASDKLGLTITEGGHVDRQELQVPVMRWFNKWLKNSEAPIENYAQKLFPQQQLRVFNELPRDERTSRCYEDFTVLAMDDKPLSTESVIADLRTKTFGAWPTADTVENSLRVVQEKEHDGLRLTLLELESQPKIHLRLYVLQPVGRKLDQIDVELVDQKGFQRVIQLLGTCFGDLLTEELQQLDSQNSKTPGDIPANWLAQNREGSSAYVLIAPRCVGITALGGDPKYLTQMRRRFMLLGSTLASSQVWDTVQCLKTLGRIDSLSKAMINLRAAEAMTEIACFAVLFGPEVDHLSLDISPRNDQAAPDFLNWSRIVTPKQLQILVEHKTELSITKPAP